MRQKVRVKVTRPHGTQTIRDSELLTGGCGYQPIIGRVYAYYNATKSIPLPHIAQLDATAVISTVIITVLQHSLC